MESLFGGDDIFASLPNESEEERRRRAKERRIKEEEKRREELESRLSNFSIFFG